MSSQQTPGGDATGRQSAHSLVEQSLVEIWNTMLERTDIATTDNLFESGADSLLALVAIEQINQRLGWTLNMGDLISYPTIRDLTANKALHQAANTERMIVRMSNRGSRTPIVFIHPGLGLVAGYARLVRLLGADRGCYGVQSPRLMQSNGPHLPDSIEAMAALYTDLIEDEFGEDEFHLVGACAGGAIALEIAKLAAERDLGMRTLVLIDSYLWNATADEMTEQAILTSFREDVLRTAVSDDTVPPEGLTDADPAAVFRDVSMSLFGAEVGHADGAGTQFVQRLYDSYRATYTALGNYSPSPGAAPLDALLLLSQDNDTLDGWRGLIKGELTTGAVDDDRFGLLYITKAAELAEHIGAYLGEG